MFHFGQLISRNSLSFLYLSSLRFFETVQPGIACPGSDCHLAEKDEDEGKLIGVQESHP